ncbi:protein hupE [Marinomonas ushuaiensis DSM 15871]|uniref:Protein hupE n=1 Tax=Marinomonas ushuaiensis DSM 15871 TaxID=1122207 RepID=X7E2K0_9GAMM|nr:HupE/UreJ family protein [Marinomonas ushuaiensis]ETX10100.1 protein hupE [Marinomonas ushuaiensis DSM 15871]
MALSILKGLTATVSILISGMAFAHPGHEDVSSFMSGFSHPLGGLDHLLAMLAIGLWASSIGGRALWAVPTAFVLTMLVGGSLAVAGLSVPFVEQGILLSVVVLGALVFGAKRLPILATVVIAGGFAVFHGAAHGMEMPINANSVHYVSGFVFATAGLHTLGLGLGQLMTRFASPLMVRISGSMIAVAGLFLSIA